MVTLVSAFSKVDQSAEPARLVAYLDEAARGLCGLKHYVAAAHALRRPAKPVLDLGCGPGHDLALRESFGLRAMGVDPSETMLAAALGRGQGHHGGLVRALGEALPFSDGAFGGCRLERVLIHVAEPAGVLREACGCVVSGGLVTVLEPDCQRPSRSPHLGISEVFVHRFRFNPYTRFGVFVHPGDRRA
jgi:SAM-dependent methyltransferase